MIEAFFIFNTVGKPRIIKFYEDITYERKQEILKEIFGVAQKLEDGSCNFFQDLGVYNKKSKIVVRKYATLYFVVIIDEDESELGILDLIQIIVEALDKIFESACELDVINQPDKVYALIDEIIIGGTVIEANLQQILETLKEVTEYEKKS